MTRSWVLVGMMGSGKSSVGRALAEASGRRFVDTDQLVHHKVGRPIRQFFALYGEDAFRDLETGILQQLEPGRDVVATGGGAVLRDENWAEMRRLGPTVYLRASSETLRTRIEVSRNRRPLLQREDWAGDLARLLEARRARYELADTCVDVDSKTIEEVVNAILAEVGP